MKETKVWNFYANKTLSTKFDFHILLFGITIKFDISLLIQFHLYMQQLHKFNNTDIKQYSKSLKYI